MLLGPGSEARSDPRRHNGTDVVTLGEQQLQRDLAVGLELRRGRVDRQALLHGVVQGAAGGPTPATWTMHSGSRRRAEASISRGPDVLAVPLAATSRIVWPAVAAMTSAVDADLHSSRSRAVTPYLSTLRMSQAKGTGRSLSRAATAVRPVTPRRRTGPAGRRAFGRARGGQASSASPGGAISYAKSGSGSRSAPAPSTACRCAGGLLADAHRVRYITPPVMRCAA